MLMNRAGHSFFKSLTSDRPDRFSTHKALIS
jgi:hypothetical protein